MNSLLEFVGLATLVLGGIYAVIASTKFLHDRNNRNEYVNYQIKYLDNCYNGLANQVYALREAIKKLKSEGEQCSKP